MLHDRSDTTRSTPVQIGLVGCGRLAEFGYIPALRRVPGVKLVGVADVDPLRCSSIAPGVPAYKTIQHLIDGGQTEAIIISTPTRYHLADATVAADAKLPALVEKPPGVDSKEAERLLKLVPQPWLGFNRRFDPDVVKLKSQISHQEIFKIRLELCYRRRAWNPIDMQDDALLDLGPHLIDLARWFTTSEVTSVRAGTLTQHYAEFEVKLDRGQANIVCCCNSPYLERVSVLSKDDRVLGTFRRGGILAGIVGRFFPPSETPLLHSLVGQVEAFSCAVQGLPSTQPLGSVVDGVKVMAVIEAVRDSARASGWKCPVSHSEAN